MVNVGYNRFTNIGWRWALTDEIRYGPDKPHPLSEIRTELVWEGKYDEYGNRRCRSAWSQCTHRTNNSER